MHMMICESITVMTDAHDTHKRLAASEKQEERTLAYRNMTHSNQAELKPVPFFNKTYQYRLRPARPGISFKVVSRAQVA